MGQMEAGEECGEEEGRRGGRVRRGAEEKGEKGEGIGKRED